MKNQSRPRSAGRPEIGRRPGGARPLARGPVRLFLVLAAFLGLAAAPAGADPFTGGLGTVELPAGWTAAYERDGIDMITLSAPDRGCRVVIMLGPVVGVDSKGGAEMLAQKIGHATTPEPGPGRDSYRFFSEAKPGQRMEVTVFVHNMAMMGWAQSGEVERYAGDLKIIWNSLSSHAPKFQALFEALYKL